MHHSTTGFPSPAEEYRRPPLSLDALLIRFQSNTHFIRYEGDAMAGFGFNHGDLLIVERCIEYFPGQIVMAFVNGERVVRQYQRFPDGVALCPGNVNYPVIHESEISEIFGRVLHSITHHLQIKQHLLVAN
jgi:DNA polymerase V